jgi:hypothetical protein
MHPVLKRVLLNGGATAVVLAAIGLVFAEMASMWAGAPGPPGQPARDDLNPPVGPAIRYRVPLMMAFWGFMFVAVSEVVLYRLRRRVPSPKPVAPPVDEAEKLLNELLEQAESKMALEADMLKAEEQKREAGGTPHEAEKKEKADG